MWIFSMFYILACENIRFSSLFAAGDVSRGKRPQRKTSPVAKSEEKRMFSQAIYIQNMQYNS